MRGHWTEFLQHAWSTSNKTAGGACCHRSHRVFISAPPHPLAVVGHGSDNGGASRIRNAMATRTIIWGCSNKQFHELFSVAKLYLGSLQLKNGIDQSRVQFPFPCLEEYCGMQSLRLLYVHHCITIRRSFSIMAC